MDAGSSDAGADLDAGVGDAGAPDGGPDDAGSADAGPEPDAGAGDAGASDAGPFDAGSADAGPNDAGTPDAGPSDAGTPDAGPYDAGTPDAGPPADAGAPDAGPSCTNLCLQQVSCPDGGTTTLRGTIYAPNGVDPVANARIYVPNAAVPPRVQGVTCDRCDAAPPGSPLVSTVSAIDGTFTLTNVPVGTGLPLVVTKGRWRRQAVVPVVAACTANAAASNSTRLPHNHLEGDVPYLAFSTGAVDALECVLRKIGVHDAEFTAPGGAGHIHLYEGLTDHNSQNATTTIWASGGARAQGSPLEDQLWTTLPALEQYDAVFFPCQADQADPSLRSAAVHQNLVNYVNAGGRVFATHFSYIWLYATAPFSSSAAWNVEQHPSPTNQTGYVDLGFDGGSALAAWLSAVGASSTPGEISLQVIRHDYDSVTAPGRSWMTINDVNFPGASVLYMFDAPIGTAPAQQCGRVLFNEFHVENVSFAPTIGALFPAECSAGAMTPQEKLLEYLIFELGDCL